VARRKRNEFARIATTFIAAVLLASCTDEGRVKTKVVVLGFDGAGWDTIDPLIDAGKLPLLARLKREAAWGPLETFKPTKSPVIWTSIATGKSMTQHGILDFVFMENNDIQVPYSNSERREPSIWQILDHFDRRSVVVNWFVTYPPDEIDGIMVSNRFRKILLLPEERRDQMADSIHPPELFETLRPFASLDYADIRLERELPDIAALHESLGASHDAATIPVLRDYWIYVLQEALTESVSRYLYENEEFDLFATYFRLPDIVQHVALSLIEPELVDSTLAKLRRGELSEADATVFRERLALVLEPFYRYMESIIDSYLRTLPGDDTYLFVISDHGFTLHADGYDHYHIPEETDAPAGIFLMTGPDTVAGAVPAVSVYDIAPTILYLLGLPVGENMNGKPLLAAVELERELSYQRYGRELMTPKEHLRDTEIDARTLEELRSLGYIP
jgi:predicted AlkP superfamily phosphohydrolase/phosphomutase